MSRVLDEFNRIADAKESIKNAIINAGVDVPNNVKIDAYAPYVESITGGSGTNGDLIVLNLRSSGNITLPASIHAIGEYCFSDHDYLTSVNAPGLTSIGNYAFKGCSSLTSITDTSKLTIIPVNAFQACSSLEHIDLSNVEVIGDSAFAGCTSLSFDQPLTKLTSIVISAFSNCKSFTTVDFFPSVKTISGRHNFGGCSNMQTITLPSIEEIDSTYMFNNCTALTTVDLGPNLRKFYGARAFDGCDSLQTFICRATTPPTLTYVTFPSAVTIYVPAGSVDAYKTATGWYSYASQIQAIQS